MNLTPEEIAAKKHAYYLANKHKWKESYHRCYSAEKNRPRCAKWRAKNRQHLCERQKKWAAENPEKVKAQKQEYEKKNRVSIRAKRAIWRDKNRDSQRAYYREYMAKRADTDENFKLKGSLRSRITSALKRKGLCKSRRTLDLVGCDIPFLRGYIEARFQPGMTWQNFGEWHIDHRVPCAEFDLRDTEQQKQCFNYSNLQPLWAFDNLTKAAKPPKIHQGEFL